MALLIVREKGVPDRSFTLDGDEFFVGRSDDAHLRLPNVSVSRFHTRVYRKAGEWQYEDMQSQNGTLINGTRQSTGTLNDGDELYLGKYSLVFIHDGVNGMWRGRSVDTIAPFLADDSQVDDEHTYELSPEMIRQMQAAARRIKTARLEDIATGEQWEPRDETLLFGGRGSIPVQGMTNFMTAAKILWNGKRHVVQRVGWMSLSVNGKKVKQSVLEDGDRVRIGATEFEYILA